MHSGIYLIFLILCTTFCQEILSLSEENIEKSWDLHIRKKRLIDRTLKRNRSNLSLFQHVPYIVHIHKDGVPYCAGSILTSSVVITAAYCVHNQAEYTVLSGSMYVNLGTLRHNVTGKLLHHMYNLHTKQYDIALIHVSPHIDLVHSINRRIELYQGNVPDHTLGIISGWGCIDESGPEKIYPTQLQSIVVPIFNRESCRFIRRNEPAVSEENICTYDKNNNKRSSFGDTGDPLVVEYKLLGVLSWTGTRQNPSSLDVFVKVSHPLIRNWIVANTHIVEGW